MCLCVVVVESVVCVLYWLCVLYVVCVVCVICVGCGVYVAFGVCGLCGQCRMCCVRVVCCVCHDHCGVNNVFCFVWMYCICTFVLCVISDMFSEACVVDVLYVVRVDCVGRCVVCVCLVCVL